MEEKYQVKRPDLIYPELSFKINGALFEVFKQIGGGHDERYIQKAVAEALKERQIQFEEQKYVTVNYKNELIKKLFLDFLVENCIVVELKRGKFLPVRNIDQVQEYLQALGLKLAIIGCFTYNGVVIKRIINTQLVPRTE